MNYGENIAHWTDMIQNDEYGRIPPPKFQLGKESESQTQTGRYTAGSRHR